MEDDFDEAEPVGPAAGQAEAGAEAPPVKICADTFAPRPPPPYCAHGPRASAACVLYVKLTDGKGQLAPAGVGVYCTYAVHTYQPRVRRTYHRVPWHHRRRRRPRRRRSARWWPMMMKTRALHYSSIGPCSTLAPCLVRSYGFSSCNVVKIGLRSRKSK